MANSSGHDQDKLPFLPMTRAEMDARGWNELDVLLVTGDAYVDHPSFGAPLLGRWLEKNGYRVGIVAQPRWNTPEDILRMGRPRLFAGVTAGALDSMLAHYTAFRKKRHDDAYTPGGQAGARPNRACIVYANLVRQAFPGLPVVLGGIEASLRRAAHFDFWTDKVRASILLDAKADIVVYGMGERALLEIAHRLKNTPQPSRETLRGIPGTAFEARDFEPPKDALILPSLEDIQSDPFALMTATLALEQQCHQGELWAAQPHGSRTVVFAPPAPVLTQYEMDALYTLPFTRMEHPSYTQPIPAVEMIQFSITGHRGCSGGCSFCSLALHQGRHIQSRSEDSILAEAVELTLHPQWRGSISDIGGPTANLWGAECSRPKDLPCRRSSCLYPKPCHHLRANLGRHIRMLDKVKALPGVKHVRVASGIRHDLLAAHPEYLRRLVADYVGGQLKLAPEHSQDRVLDLMRKPSFKVFVDFLAQFERETHRAAREQYVIPYLLSAFPGCTDADMRALAQWLKSMGWRPQQVQCFIPTPGTVATAMYYSERDPEGNQIPVARTDAERIRQHQILVPR